MTSLKRNFIYNVVYQMLLIILPLITAPYIARTLGAEGVGIYSYTYSVAQYFLLFAMLGISNHGNRSIAAVRDNREKLSKTFWSIYSIQAFMYVLAIIAYLIYLFVFDVDNKIIVAIQFIYVVSGALDISWYFFGTEQFKVTVTRNTVIKIVTVILMFIFVHNPGDLAKYTIIMSGGTFFSQAYLWTYIFKQVSVVRVNWFDIKRHIKEVIILFIPVVAYSIYKLMDKIMLGNMTTYMQVGYYENAGKIINIPMGIITALGTVMLPRMSNMIAKGERQKAIEYIKISIKLVTLIGSAIAFGLIGVSNILVPVYFGYEYTPCIMLINLLSITVFFISWANVVRTQYLMPLHHDKIYIESMIIGAVANFIINSMLIPRFSGVGAAVGTIVAEFTVMIVQMIGIRKEFPIFLFCWKSIPYLVIGFIMQIIVRKYGIFFEVSITTLIGQVVIGGIVYCTLCGCYFKLFKDELGIIIISEINKKIKRKNV